MEMEILTEKKIAFFVEGQTEQIFISRLLIEILGNTHTTLIQKGVRGGTNSPKRQFVKNISAPDQSLYRILVVDCGSDNKVKSEMLEHIENLRDNHYQLIVGLRDLYPIPIDELDKLQKGLRFLPAELKSESPYFDIIVAVHEVEAWFLGEINHYNKVSSHLTSKYISKQLGFNPFTTNMELREHPAEDLNNIYQLVGKSYTKHYGQTKRLVNLLDYQYLQNKEVHQMKSLSHLIDIIKKFKYSVK